MTTATAPQSHVDAGLAPAPGERPKARDADLGPAAGDPVALAAALLLLLLVVVVVAAPLTAPRDPLRQESSVRLSPPLTPGYRSAPTAGRDMLSRMIWGGQISLVVGVAPRCSRPRSASRSGWPAASTAAAWTTC